jgi:hypothetical protein
MPALPYHPPHSCQFLYMPCVCLPNYSESALAKSSSRRLGETTSLSRIRAVMIPRGGHRYSLVEANYHRFTHRRHCDCNVVCLAVCDIARFQSDSRGKVCL